MNTDYRLITKVIRNDRPISRDPKFNKLTLSAKREPVEIVDNGSNKQIDENKPEKNIEKTSTINRVLLSSSTSNNLSQPFSKRLEFSDSDETNCSPVSKDELSFLPNLNITNKHSFGNSNNNKLQQQQQQPHRSNAVAKLSQQFDTLQIVHGNEPISTYLSGTTISNDTDDQNDYEIQSNIHKQQQQQQQQRKSDEEIFSISSNSTTDNTKKSEYEEIIILSSDSENNETDDDDANYDIQTANNMNDDNDDDRMTELNENVSSIVSSKIGLSSSVMAEVNNFFNNIPPLIDRTLAHGTESSSNQSSFNNANNNNDLSLIVSETSVEESFSSAVADQPNKSHDKNETEKCIINPIENIEVAETEVSAGNANGDDDDDKIVKSPEIIKTTPNVRSISTLSKLTPQINISAKFKIKIKVPCVASSSSSSSSSSGASSGNDGSSSSSSTKSSKESIKSTTSPVNIKNIQKSLNNLQISKKPNNQTNIKTTLNNTAATKKKMNKVSNVNESKNIEDVVVVASQSSIKTIKNNVDPYDCNTLKMNAPTNELSTSKRRINGKNEKSPSALTGNAAEIEIDDESAALLDELYGNAWKTPDLLRKCSIRKKKIQNEIMDTPKLQQQQPIRTSGAIDDTFANEFCNYRNNLPSDLESTRITPANKKTKLLSEMNNKPTLSPFFKKPQGIREMRTEPKKHNSPERNLRNLRTVQKGRWKKIQFLDSTTSSEDEPKVLNSNSDDDGNDDEWKCSDKESVSSDSEKENIKKSNTKKSGRNKSNNNDSKIVYLDLTNVEIEVDKDHSTPNATAKDLEKINAIFFESCEFKKNIYDNGTETPRTNTKRKLFTHNYDTIDTNQNDPINIQSNDTNSPNDDQSPVHLNAIPFTPINRILENIKKTEIKTIPSPKKKSTPRKLPPKSNRKLPGDGNEEPQVNGVFRLPQTPSRLNKHEIVELKPGQKHSFLRSLEEYLPKQLCDSEAIFYRDNFKKNRNELTQKLYSIYNENVFDNKLDVPIVWNKKLLNTAGRCHNKKKQGIRTSRIELSEKVLTSADRLRCTLIHEMCHAATWIYNEENGHGATWKKWTLRANTIFPELPKIAVCHQYDIEYKYTYKCTMCGNKSQAHSKSKKVENIRCAYCHGSIEIFLNKKDLDGNRLLTPVREASGFAKFIKEQYKNYKKPGVTHTDVMKSLSAAFAAVKLAK